MLFRSRLSDEAACVANQLYFGQGIVSTWYRPAWGYTQKISVPRAMEK
jgi:hypothetical protein